MWHQQEHEGLGDVTTRWHQQKHEGLGGVTTRWHQQEHEGLGGVTTCWHQQEHKGYNRRLLGAAKLCGGLSSTMMSSLHNSIHPRDVQMHFQRRRVVRLPMWQSNKKIWREWGEAREPVWPSGKALGW